MQCPSLAEAIAPTDAQKRSLGKSRSSSEVPMSRHSLVQMITGHWWLTMNHNYNKNTGQDKYIVDFKLINIWAEAL